MIYYIFEAFLIIFTFFLPLGYFLPPLENPADFMNSPLHLNINSIFSFLHILFLLFLLNRDKNIPLKDFGLVKPRPSDIFHGIFFAAGLFVLYFLLILIISTFPLEMQEVMTSGFRWKLENRLMIPAVFIFCLLTGYREELLFRAYIITRCSQFSIPVPYAIVVSVFSFGILHIYMGISGLLFALFSGIYLSIIFVLKKNLHIIAICHGMFNFCALLLIFCGIG